MFVQTYPEFNGLGISATPGVCYLCRTHRRETEEAVLSTGVFIEQEGHLEVCQGCVMEMAGHFGAISPSRAEAMRKTNRSLGMQFKAELSLNDSLRKQIEALTDQAEALRDALKQ